MMKILYCIPSLSESGGTERIITEKVNYLVRQNFNIIIVTTEGKNCSPFFKLDPKIKVVELNINFNDITNKSFVFKYLETKRKLRVYKKKLHNLINNESVDICISTGAKEIEFLYKLNVNCKKICELHFSKYFRKQTYLAKKSGFLWKILGDYRNKQFVTQTKTLDKLVVLTKQDEKEWASTNTNVAQIYNFSAFDSDKISDVEEKVVIAVGRLTEQKGFDRLLESWSHVCHNYQDWTLKIFGIGELEEQLKKQANDLGISTNVRFEGQTNDVSSQILKSSIFALPSRYEGFPLVLLESITCGVPIVSFDCKTGPNEIITNNDCGILVEDGNVEKFAEALTVLIKNTEQRKTKAHQAKIKSKLFSKNVIMEEWVQLFNKL